jgi:hypothetical protein
MPSNYLRKSIRGKAPAAQGAPGRPGQRNPVAPDAFGTFRYLFFGTHGFLADNLAGIQEPTLVLSQVDNEPPENGFLTFHEVLHLKLDADLVALADLYDRFRPEC